MASKAAPGTASMSSAKAELIAKKRQERLARRLESKKTSIPVDAVTADYIPNQKQACKKEVADPDHTVYFDMEEADKVDAELIEKADGDWLRTRTLRGLLRRAKKTEEMQTAFQAVENWEKTHALQNMA